MNGDDCWNRCLLRRTRPHISEWTDNATMKLGDINVLRLEETSDFPECFPSKRDVEWQERNINAVNPHSINHCRTRRCCQYDHLVPCQLQVTSEIVDLHFDSTEARDITIGDQGDLETSTTGTNGVIGVGHTTPRDSGRTLVHGSPRRRPVRMRKCHTGHWSLFTPTLMTRRSLMPAPWPGPPKQDTESSWCSLPVVTPAMLAMES